MCICVIVFVCTLVPLYSCQVVSHSLYVLLCICVLVFLCTLVHLCLVFAYTHVHLCLSVRMYSCASVLLSSGVSFFVCTLVHLCLSVSMYSCASVLSVRIYSL